MMPRFDRRLLRARFAAAADRYDEVAVLQHEVESRLLESALSLQPEPARIVDVGCGPGRALALLQQRYRRATVLGVDLARPDRTTTPMPVELVIEFSTSGTLHPLPAVQLGATVAPAPDLIFQDGLEQP